MDNILKAQFKADFIDLITYKRGGHIGSWLYNDAYFEQDNMTGADIMGAFNQSATQYYPAHILPKLISKAVNKYAPYFSQFKRVADFGVGSKEMVLTKSMPIVKGCPNAEIYCPIDLSQHYLKGAKHVANDNCPNLRVTLQQIDFFRQHMPDQHIDTLGIMFGLTLHNVEMKEGDDFPIEEYVQKLNFIKASLNGGNNMFLPDVDINQDSESIIRAYDNLHGNRFVKNLMYLVEKELAPQGNFKPHAWAHQLVWDSEKHVLHNCIRCLENQDFEIDGEKYVVRDSERFPCINSVKMPLDKFHEIAKYCDFGIEDSVIDDQNKMALPLLIC